MEPQFMRHLETRLVHAGEPRPRIGGAVVMPIFQSATYVHSGDLSYHDVRYIRLNNTPNFVALTAKLAALENGEAALVAASGMAAISATLLTVLRTGDHLLANDSLYGGTHNFITEDLESFGIQYSFFHGDDPDGWKKELRPNTKAIYVETITNPLMRVPDLPAVVKFARAHGLLSLIDNTFATPVNYCPLDEGFDLVLHSCTKYLNGHTDIVAGTAIGPAGLVERIRHRLNHLGGALDPHACFLLHRGLKTLAVRLRHQNESALRVAHFLETHAAVAGVNYPGLESHPQHERARSIFRGFGGMLSFELPGGVAQADRLIASLTLPLSAPSLGGPETLITRPAATSHAGIAPEERRRLGISDGLIRLSVGLEATEDLIEDLDRALQAAG